VVDHAEFLHQVPDEALQEVLPAAKKIALALDCKDYNLLQNNGKLAHQAVGHVHFHLIPKLEDQGLHIKWQPLQTTSQQLEQLYKKLLSKQ
jgi:diadenosine tetraphosphate (Ap4A) HIT family hydrolase